MQRMFGLVALACTLFFSSCLSTRKNASADAKPIERPSIPDYHDLFYWAAHPDKKDPSDSVPAPLKKEYQPDSTVDVFFLHPTTFTAPSELWNADINDTAINAKTDRSTILFQASAFNEFRIFAPRYRQANLHAYYTTDTAHALAAFDEAYEDISRAFKYYLDHYNNGRPIIIASHSQGTTHALRLLKEYFDGKPLQKQLVAAYVIGMHIPSNYYSSLEMCRDSLQTGCLCGWRSFKYGYEPEFVKNETDSGMVTNPLTWTTNSEPAPRSLNAGAVLRKFNKLYPMVADATVNKKVLWIDEIKFPGSVFLKMKNYHIGDINLFYMNIRKNLRQRVASFRTQSGSQM
jgi:hypothetical protein